MTVPLWTRADLVAATGAVECEPSEKKSRGRDGEPVADITGISIDTRTIKPGDLFVALKDTRDGHDFVATAFNKGAAAALVARHYARQPDDGLLLRVDDPLVALEALGRAARNRLSPDARVIAVTGSAGKTTTKEMLRTALAAIGPTHASEKSYNNHWGVPLTLARMPASTRFGVFEIGMNHAGEITPLSRMVRPHIAIITTVGEAHIEHFPDGVAGIARAKAEIFAGLEPGGVVVLPGNSPQYPLLAKLSADAGAQVVSFGQPFDLTGKSRHVNSLDLTSYDYEDDPFQPQTVWVNSRPGQLYDQQLLLRFSLGLRGRHMALNSAAVVLALDRIGISDLDRALAPLATLGLGPGRGERTRLQTQDGDVLLVDESYNANPASMRAAFATLSQIPQELYPRRIAVLGDMLELGADAPQLHAGLVADLEAAAVDLVLACGPNMKHLYDALPTSRQGTWAETSAGLVDVLLGVVRPGDVVMIKGSNGTRMAPLVDALKARHDLAAPPR